MNLYDAEMWLLDRHAERLADAERLAGVYAVASRRRALAGWAAGRLRILADRLDGGARFEPRVVSGRFASGG